ncbi:MAG: RagB/SusD family nutrient uptake outer membrane protein [Ferruginibacter sp.]
MKKLIYIVLISIGLFPSFSCKKDLLSPTPDTVISDASAFDKPYRIANQVLALYSQLKSGLFYGGRYIVYGDIRGEDFLLEDPNLVTNADVWALNPTNSANAVVNLWNQAYLTINSCNLFIDGMASTGSAVVGPTLSNNYLGEARLIRALSYYSLLQYYARPYADGNGGKLGLPLRLTGIKGPGASDMARNTVAEVYTQIISDLDFAEANLPLSYTGTGQNTIRAHRNTSIALKTRVYLSMQKYDKVVSEGVKIVPDAAPFVGRTGVLHALQPKIVDVFKAGYITTESIFSLPFTTTAGDIPGTQNGLQAYYYASANGNGSIFSLNPNGIIANPGWSATDDRRLFIFTSTSAVNLGKKYLTKYPTPAPADFAPVIRWAEVLLNYAEGIVRSKNSVEQLSIDLLNAVRHRSDPNTTFTTADFAAPSDLINAIMTERRIEFLGEGLRNNDLMRLLQTIPAKGAAGAKGPSDEGYIWPASSTEKSLNKLWVD